MALDPIVEEIRRVRAEYAQRFDYDVRAIARALNELQRLSGRTVLSLPPRRIETAAQAESPDVRS